MRLRKGSLNRPTISIPTLNIGNSSSILNKKEQMIALSERMIKAADSPMVPTDQWIEAHDYRFKSLLMKGEDKETIEEAIETLKRI